MVNNIFSIIVTTIKKTFSFSGRASRKEFVIFNLFYFITIFIVYSTEEIYAISNDITLIVFLTLFYLCVLIFTIPPLFSLIVRRLHDLNASAWWLLITFIPFGALLFFALPFKKGSSGNNKYGEPPID